VFLTTDDGLQRAQACENASYTREEPGILVSGISIMIRLEKITDEEFERHTLSLLRRELGLDGLARFLRVYRAGSGDYARNRHLRLEGSTISGSADHGRSATEVPSRGLNSLPGAELARCTAMRVGF
jgi:hypothetical protein